MDVRFWLGSGPSSNWDTTRASHPRWACLSFNLSAMDESQERPLMTHCGHCPSTRKGSASTPHSAGFGEPFRDELLNGDIFYSLKEAQVLIERWRRHYNEVRLHSALGYRPPASRDIMPRRANPGFAVDGLRPGQHLTETVPRLT